MVEPKGQRRHVRSLIAEGRGRDLLSLLPPSVASAHVALHDGDADAAGRTLCLRWRKKYLAEEYLFGDAIHTLRLLHHIRVLSENRGRLDSLRRVSVVLAE